MSTETPQQPKLWLTSMSHGGLDALENAREMIEPIRHLLDGVIWVLHDTDASDAAAVYLESVRGQGRVIHRGWPAGRHWHSMNETLFTGLMEEGDYVLFCDPLERPAVQFVSRVKEEIGPLMQEAERSVLFYFGKPYLFIYRETLEYRQSPHWTLVGWPGHPIEWSQMEPDEGRVRLNVRPIKRADQPYHWVGHMLRYWISYPAGSNSAALGLDHFPPGDRNTQFVQRETRRLQFRQMMRARGFPLTVDGFVALCRAGLDDELKAHLRAEKTLSDGFHYLVNGNTAVKSSHKPSDAIPI